MLMKTAAWICNEKQLGIRVLILLFQLIWVLTCSQIAATELGVKFLPGEEPVFAAQLH